MHTSIGGAIFIALCVFAGLSFENLGPDEMGEVTFLGIHLCSVGPGPKFIPWLFCRLYRFPTRQIPLTLQVPIITAEADRADFFVDGIRRKLTDFTRVEQAALREDPLSHRSTIIVEVSVLFEFVREELYDFITKIGSFERLGEQLGLVIKNSLEGLLSKITVNTVLEEKDALQPIFEERLLALIQKRGSRSWAIQPIETLIGPVSLHEDIVKANLLAATAFAEKKRKITLAEGDKAADILRGEGKARIIQVVGRELRTDEGKSAAAVMVSEQIFTGATKAIVAPGLAGIMGGGVEFLESLQTGKK